ncbi:MAG: hypothetical protein HFH62_08415 [Lachnospiraceae bacterium]|nr:hypothetical protein [Lachnospiraceae bacterium]
MFEGSMQGDLMGICFYLFFQATGIWMTYRMLAGQRFSVAFRCLLGSVGGTLAFQWFPILFAFFLDFTVAAHLAGAALQILLCLAAWYKAEKGGEAFPYRRKGEWLRLAKENPCLLLMMLAFFFFAYCLATHTIPLASDGSMHTGQGTYGDMNMHLGFITSIANQKSFPPEYSICPGFKLSYPFLCDSISSSLYIWGASLRTAYIFPMLVAFCQVMAGFYCFIKYWLGRSYSALVAWVLFFLNGGLGFIYFASAENLSRNFTDFYFTPTSLGDKNMRWAQILVNMLIPQRATLFGWAVLFPLMALLICAVRRKSRLCFALAGIFAGALPMIHTHSFLALGMVCAMWLLFDCKRLWGGGRGKEIWLRAALPAGILLFSLLQWVNQKDELVKKNGLLLLGVGIGFLAFYIALHIVKVIMAGEWRGLLGTWGMFLVIVLVLAVPQLFLWTFGQAGAEGFVRGHFNWSNTGNQYVWFYLKNIGLAFALYVPAYFLARKKDVQIASPLLLIWFVAELVVFQPNEYDNNKILFVGYVFMCGLAADFLVSLFSQKWPKILKAGVGVALAFVATVSAGLTMGREWVSDYELYSRDSVKACRFIEEMTEPGDVILTGTYHNNGVASLTGRNIVCGAGTFLYYHGLDYGQRESDIPLMYQDPAGYADLFGKYGVKYVYVSGMERGSYGVNDQGLAEMADCIYSEGDVQIYQMKEMSK